MGKFSPKYKARGWIGTLHIGNFENTGLSEDEYKEPEILANLLVKTWENSGKDRTAGTAICLSLEGTYHAHVALYGNTTTLKRVSEIMFNAHIEPQLGGKDELQKYLLKEPPYDDKGEIVLYSVGIENVQDVQGKRSDLENIALLLEQGETPSEIMENFAYRRYEKMIKSAYIDKRIKEMPLVKDMRVEWHIGASGTGKTYYYTQLCETHSPEDIYMTNDFENGGFDFYIEQGAPPILFLDEFKGNMKFATLLTVLDKYSRTQTHCRYANTFNLWSTVIITSIFPPDEIYPFMVENTRQERDKIDQLLRRIDVIVYHYIVNSEYKTFTIPTSEYTNYEDLKKRALSTGDGLMAIEDSEQVYFGD